MASLYQQVPSVSSIFALYSSLSAITMLFRRILSDFVPKRLQDYITEIAEELFSYYFQFQSSFTFVIKERWEFVDNQTFRAAEVYLQTRLPGLSTTKLVVGSGNLKNPGDQVKLGIPVNTKILDEFEGIHLVWTLNSVETKNYPYEKRYFHLTCKKEFREKIMTDYFTYLAKSAATINGHREKLKIYSYNQDRYSQWQPTVFEHHTTFETLAIEPDLKKTVIDDLDAFSKGKDFFKSVGRAWKRGYLLYGPPGTGKSSMVAAIANYMKYHIYDLQLQSVKDDAELRKILTSTKNGSILLIEDIDCGSDASRMRKTSEKKEDGELQNAEKPDVGVSWKIVSVFCYITSVSEAFESSLWTDIMSGLLNFVDGLWSSCGEKRIIIFTTVKLDPALLRPGRMDVHILMGYCTPFVFKKLVAMYLKIDDHVLFGPIEELVLEVSVTPAEVTQQLMVSKNADIALKGLFEYLETKKMRKEEDTETKEAVLPLSPFAKKLKKKTNKLNQKQK